MVKTKILMNTWAGLWTNVHMVEMKLSGVHTDPMFFVSDYLIVTLSLTGIQQNLIATVKFSSI